LEQPISQLPEKVPIFSAIIAVISHHWATIYQINSMRQTKSFDES
jgi:hypothetical protein